MPFRLTRDVLDGMGVAGIEGVFTRCSEKCLSVLKGANEELKTIIEVMRSIIK